jgi:hypothetical protein
VTTGRGSPAPDGRDELDDRAWDPYREPKDTPYDPGSYRSTPRANGTEGRNAAAWPLAGLALVLGVAALTFATTHSASAIIVISAVVALVVLLADYFTD